MFDNDTKRITRLTAILTQLQSKRFVTTNKLAEKFGINNRTIYRDIKTIESAGVPIFVLESYPTFVGFSATGVLQNWGRSAKFEHWNSIEHLC